MAKKTNPDDFKCYPLGDAAIVIQLGNQISPLINGRVRAVCAYLDEYSFEGFIEYVPAFTTVTIYYEPWIINYNKLLPLLQELASEVLEQQEVPAGTLLEIPVLYGGEWGPDLDFVASHNKMTAAEVIALHTAPDYLVYMIGFAPGFPYLGGMNELISAPRKDNPRSKIPAGSVGIAGQQTGIYPIETPGGWQIIGRSPINLFDLNSAVPALLKAGDRVRFSAISETEFKKIRRGRNGN
ncbi:5-oxoprolinase subunit PxpB [Pedobacter steynii]|uniref:Kinase inhibitor n=1 Tax=Pedobacter steynii TaxID=430522 RepID=A0A1D7QJ25_9SPHI|nr:5-oxoprolinase subunit PxpB [Pedobacter steynii]AOM78682.1 kinase inhibitor [Pedobacter steynii]